jgi:hypothetical protein
MHIETDHVMAPLVAKHIGLTRYTFHSRVDWRPGSVSSQALMERGYSSCILIQHSRVITSGRISCAYTVVGNVWI